MPRADDPWGPAPDPDPCEVIDVDRAFTRAQVDLIRRGRRPREMEDKWFLEFEGLRLRCRRSWTGYCVFVVEFQEEAGGGLRAVRVKASRDTPRYESRGREEDLAILRFLIDRVLLGDADVALPPGMDAITAWALFGRASL